MDREETAATKTIAERFDEYSDGLFWITFFGLGFILGGAIVLKVLQFSPRLVVAYLILSTVAFLINFGLNLREALRLARCLKNPESDSLTAQRDTNKILPVEGAMPSELAQSSATSVTDDTTRSFEPIPK